MGLGKWYRLFKILEEIKTQQSALLAQGERMASEMEDLKGSIDKLVTDVDTEIAAIQAGSTDLHTRLDAALAAAKAAADQDATDKAALEAKSAALDAAVAELAALKSQAVTLTQQINGLDQKVTDAGTNLGVTLPPAAAPDAGTGAPVEG